MPRKDETHYFSDTKRCSISSVNRTIAGRRKIADPDCNDHTRLPGYLRNKIGTIDLVYPDCYAYFPGPSDCLQTPQVSYSVKFDPKDIWGEAYSESGSMIYADLFECYIAASA